VNDMGPFWDAICLLDKAVVNKKTSEMYRPAQRVLEAATKVDVKAGIKEMGDLIIAAQKAARSSEASRD